VAGFIRLRQVGPEGFFEMASHQTGLAFPLDGSLNSWENTLMMTRNRIALIAAALLLTLTAACSSKSFLVVNYQLPPSSDSLENIQTSLEIVDVRDRKTFLSENARKSLKGFNEAYSLVVLKSDGSGNLLGVYDVDSLISEIFRQRLQNFGVQVSSSGDTAPNNLEIKLKQFELDLVRRKWVVKMNYQASLIKAGRLVATESVNGSAERLKLTGKSDAEKVLSELITDMANKLNVATIFEHAGP
jgi:hypothetical protein